MFDIEQYGYEWIVDPWIAITFMLVLGIAVLKLFVVLGTTRQPVAPRPQKVTIIIGEHSPPPARRSGLLRRSKAAPQKQPKVIEVPNE